MSNTLNSSVKGDTVEVALPGTSGAPPKNNVQNVCYDRSHSLYAVALRLELSFGKQAWEQLYFSHLDDTFFFQSSEQTPKLEKNVEKFFL